MATKTRTPLGAAEAQTVLRRAAELDREHAPALPTDSAEPRIEPGELERIAAESGLSPESLRRAIDELRGGALERPPQRAADAVARQTFGEPAAIIDRRLSAALADAGLEPVRRGPDVTRWEGATGLHRTVARAINWRGASAFIGATVESSVYDVPGERSCAVLRGDAKDLRLPFATLAALLLAFPAGIALLVTLAIGLRSGFGLQHAVAGAAVVACWFLLSALISRGLSRRRARKLQRSLERVLAQLGEPAHGG